MWILLLLLIAVCILLALLIVKKLLDICKNASAHNWKTILFSTIMTLYLGNIFLIALVSINSIGSEYINIYRFVILFVFQLLLYLNFDYCDRKIRTHVQLILDKNRISSLALANANMAELYIQKEDLIKKLEKNKKLLEQKNNSLANANVNISELYLRLEDQKEKADFYNHKYSKLLHAVFPPTVVKQLSNTEFVKPKRYNNVAILFADIVGFTKYTESHEAEMVVNHLQELVELWDSTSIKHKVQKIKTIGDAFMATSGMLEKSTNPVRNCVNFSVDIIKQCQHLSHSWKLRVGITYGSVVAGIVGHHQYLFDVWGDKVNAASRIQSLAKANCIYLDKAAWSEVKDDVCCELVGNHQLKGKKNPVEIYAVLIEKFNKVSGQVLKTERM